MAADGRLRAVSILEMAAVAIPQSLLGSDDLFWSHCKTPLHAQPFDPRRYAHDLSAAASESTIRQADPCPINLHFVVRDLVWLVGFGIDPRQTYNLLDGRDAGIASLFRRAILQMYNSSRRPLLR